MRYRDEEHQEGQDQYWTGYKLHLDVADGQMPISAILTSASVHDSQVAIPLMTVSCHRVVYLYELMDSAYDAQTDPRAQPRSEPCGNHSGAFAARRQAAVATAEGLSRKVGAGNEWAQKDRYKERTMVERVNSRLKDEFGAN